MTTQAQGIPQKRVLGSSGLLSWIMTVDHKRIGILYIYSAFIFFLVGGLEALLMRIQLAQPDNKFLSPDAYNQVFTMQYHQEIINTTVSDWSEIPEYKAALEKALGENAVEKLDRTAKDYMLEFNKTARQLYENWKSVVYQD